jgi:hypothetical protein
MLFELIARSLTCLQTAVHGNHNLNQVTPNRLKLVRGFDDQATRVWQRDIDYFLHPPRIA